MKREFTYPSRDGVTQIHAIEWKPEEKIRAVLQICHGMVEYIDRYDEFASFLNEQGIYVIGHDHLGHGASVQSEEYHGYFHATRGNEYVIGDIHKLREMTQQNYPDIPYFLLGHSMGSFLARQYIELYAKGLAGAIIMGTGSKPGIVLWGGKILCKMIAAFKGSNYRSNLIDNMAFGSYNKRFEPSRTDKDWLTRDEKIVDAYRESPWCTFKFTVNAYYHMFCGIQYAQKKAHIKQIPENLPLFLVAGGEDPVGDFGKSVHSVAEIYRECGMKDVQLKLYPDDRHEILNELDRQDVFADLLKWMEEKM